MSLDGFLIKTERFIYLFYSMHVSSLQGLHRSLPDTLGLNWGWISGIHNCFQMESWLSVVQTQSVWALSQLVPPALCFWGVRPPSQQTLFWRNSPARCCPPVPASASADSWHSETPAHTFPLWILMHLSCPFVTCGPRPLIGLHRHLCWQAGVLT